MLDSLRHVRLDIRTGTHWLTALAKSLAAEARIGRYGTSITVPVCFLFVQNCYFPPVFPDNSGPETTRPVAVTRDGSCLFNSVLAVDPVGQGQRR